MATCPWTSGRSTDSHSQPSLSAPSSPCQAWVTCQRKGINCLPLPWFPCIYLFIYFWLRWVFIAACWLPLVAASEGYSSLRRAGFYVWWLLLLQLVGSGAQAQKLWHMALVAPQHVESSWTKDWTHVHCIGRQIRNHWDHEGSLIPTFFWSCFQMGRFCMLGRSTYIPDKSLVRLSPLCDCRLSECICQLFPWSLMVKFPTSQWLFLFPILASLIT